jgi:hypothetical protein
VHAGLAFENIPTTHGNFSKTCWCMHDHLYTKNKNHSLLDGRRPLQANGGIFKMWSRRACNPHHPTAALLCTASRVASKSALIYIYIVWFLHYCCIYIVLLNWIQYTPNKTLNPKKKKNTKPWEQRSRFVLRTRTIDPGGIALQRVHVETYRSRFVLEPRPALVPSNWSRFSNRDQWPKWTETIGLFSTSVPATNGGDERPATACMRAARDGRLAGRAQARLISDGLLGSSVFAIQSSKTIPAVFARWGYL